jgi:hypothetical protein
VSAVKAPTTKPKPWSLHDFLSTTEATLLYDQMMEQPWTSHKENHPTDASALYYGVSYQKKGGARPDEIPEIPDFLKALADRVSIRLDVRAPVNYIQCHRYGPSVPVTTHSDPTGMIVPMLVVGQERTFQVGGRHAGTDVKLMGCKSPDPNRPFGDLAGGRVCGANRGLK